jgi:hypothetical protein
MTRPFFDSGVVAPGASCTPRRPPNSGHDATGLVTEGRTSESGRGGPSPHQPGSAPRLAPPLERVGFGSRPGSEKRRERDRELRDGFSVGSDRRNETGLRDANASTERSGSPRRRGLRGSVAVVREEGIRLRH